MMNEMKNEEKKVIELANSYENIAIRTESGEDIKSIEKDFHESERQYIFLSNNSFLRQDPTMLALRTNVDEKRNYANKIFLENGGKPLSEKEKSELFDKHFLCQHYGKR